MSSAIRLQLHCDLCGCSVLHDPEALSHETAGDISKTRPRGWGVLTLRELPGYSQGPVTHDACPLCFAAVRSAIEQLGSKAKTSEPEPELHDGNDMFLQMDMLHAKARR